MARVIDLTGFTGTVAYPVRYTDAGKAVREVREYVDGECVEVRYVTIRRPR